MRTGLDFKVISGGRAFGHGVYFSPNFQTSMGYSGAGAQSWPNSELNVATCLSLNEIINAPNQFVSRTPHYVVSQLDWCQCRYLFVQTHSARAKPYPNSVDPHDSKANKPKTDKGGEQTKEQVLYPQAPGLEIYGQSGKPLQIPLSAIPLRTISPTTAVMSGPTKRTAQRLEDSDDDDAEEVNILFSDDGLEAVQSPPTKKTASRASSVDMTTSRDMYAIFSSSSSITGKC